MQRALWTCHFVAALAGLFVALAAGNPLRASEPALDADLAIVPPDAAAFVSFRAADLADKLGITDANDHPWSVAWKKQFGIPLGQVVRCTMVTPRTNSAASCYILRTDTAYKRNNVLKACVLEPKEEKHHHKVCYVSANKATAVHFVNDKVLVVGETEAVINCMAGSPKAILEIGSLDAALGIAAKHDFILWSRTGSRNDGGPWQIAPTTSSKASRSQGPTVVQARKPKLDAAIESATKMRIPEETTELSFLPFPLPGGVEAGTVILDIGEQMTVEMRLYCSDDACARKSEKIMRALVGMARAEMMAAVSELDLMDVFPCMPQDEARVALPAKLIRQAEKGLSDVRIRSADKTSIVTVIIPVDAKTLRSDMGTVVKLSESCCNCGMCAAFPIARTFLPANPLPPTRYPESPASPGDPLSGGTPYGGTPYGGTPPAYPPAPQYGPPSMVTPQPLAPALPPQAPALVTPAPAIAVKLTVANVHKETALLFTIGDNGKLNFERKVPPGEAVDVQTTSDKRWVAVLPENPAGETFIPSRATETWLLRPEATTKSAAPACTTQY